MVKKVLEALVNTDVALRVKYWLLMTKLMTLRNKCLKELSTLSKRIQNIQRNISVSVQYQRTLSEFADSATNIAEDVVYLCSGEIIRHQSEDFNPEDTAERS